MAGRAIWAIRAILLIRKLKPDTSVRRNLMICQLNHLVFSIALLMVMSILHSGRQKRIIAVIMKP